MEKKSRGILCIYLHRLQPPPPTPPYVEEYHIKYYGKHTSHSADMTRTKPAEYRDRLTDKDMSGLDWI